MRVIPWVLSFLLVAITNTSSYKDPHGGIPMGPRKGCDDGKNGIEIDWNPKSKKEYTCRSGRFRNPRVSVSNQVCTSKSKTRLPIHVCLNRKIKYKDRIPTSGPHRPVWPMYGEYKYIPPQRWLHSLEHGAVVFLFHPCSDGREVEELRKAAKACLRRYIMTPSKRLNKVTPYAVLTWGCKLTMSRVNEEEVKVFIKEHALNGREQNWKDGDYNVSLIEKSTKVSDASDSNLCPGFVAENKKSRKNKDRGSGGNFLKRAWNRNFNDHSDHMHTWGRFADEEDSDHDFDGFSDAW